MAQFADQLNLFSLNESSESLEESIRRFKNREAKAKDVFQIYEIDKPLAYDFVRRYHYLGKAEFFAKYAFGLWCCGELVGVAAFSNPQGTVALKGWFGLENDDQSVLELLCCGGEKVVLDKRNNQWYSCPICTKKLEKIEVVGHDNKPM